MKTFFSIKDNILDKRLSSHIHSKAIVNNRKAVATKIAELITFYSENFTS